MGAQPRAWRLLSKCFTLSYATNGNPTQGLENAKQVLFPKLCHQFSYKHLNIQLFVAYNLSFRYGYTLQFSFDILLGLISLDYVHMTLTWLWADNSNSRSICGATGTMPAFHMDGLAPSLQWAPKLKMRKPSKRTQSNFSKRKIIFVYHSAPTTPYSLSWNSAQNITLEFSFLRTWIAPSQGGTIVHTTV